MYSATPRLALATAIFILGMGLATSARSQNAKTPNVESSAGAAPELIQGTHPVEPEFGNVGSFTPSLIFAMHNSASVDEFGTFDPPLPGSFSGIGPVTETDYCGAGGATPDGSVYYLVCGTVLDSIDTATGDVTNIGDFGTPRAFAGMDRDPVTGTWYGIATECNVGADLYTLDLDAGTATLVGAVTNQTCPVGIAFTPDGDLYSLDIVANALFGIDKATGADSSIGDIGYDANFGQDMFWDYLNETMYLTAFNFDAGQPELRSVDLASGLSTLEWVFTVNQVDAAGAPADGVAAPRPPDPTLVVNVTGIDFGILPLGEADTAEVQLMNIGEATLNISDISLDGGGAGFAVDLASTDMTLDTDEQTSFFVVFAPTVAGALSDNVTIASDDPASPASVALTGTGRDASLDEPCELETFTVVSPANGGSPVSLTCEGGVDSQGNVVGFHFIGDEAGSSGNSSWASDTCMIIEAPDGTTTYGVGGISGTDPLCNVNDWAFQGGGSTEDGTYESTHDGVFAEVEDSGTWTFTFINDWNSTSAADMTWSNVVVTLRKVPSIATEATPGEIAEVLGVPSPNPVRGTATFPLAVANGQNVTVEVFDVTGRRIQTLYSDALASGMSETLTLNASALPAGVYVIRATGEDFVKTRRVTVVR